MKQSLDQLFKSKAENQAESALLEMNSESTFYLHCFKGNRASKTFVALNEVSVKNVRMYFDSQDEWFRESELPIDDAVLSREAK